MSATSTRDVISFLSQLNHNNTTLVQSPALICFTGATYPGQLFAAGLKKCTALDSEEGDWQSICAQLTMSFLGTVSSFWLGNISALSEKKRAVVLGYLDVYQGPHTVLFFLSEEHANTMQSLRLERIACADITQPNALLALSKVLVGSASPALGVIARTLFAAHKTVPLDTASMLVYYSRVLGRNSSLFVEQWLDRIIISPESLFTLSKYFFARNEHAFFAAYTQIEQEYTPVFWVNYWSEQIFRAYFYIQAKRAGDAAQARTLAFKLPFTFVQSGWRAADTELLLNAHQALYEIDCDLKNGASAEHLLAFYGKYFAGLF